jgi:radical SAM protein with 4Fe4S-binding SPASM domain
MSKESPDYVQFYPTLRCDLSCAFCFNRGLPVPEDVTLHDVERIVSVLAGRGVREMDILGGEPTLHSRFNEIADILHENNLRTTVSTNGRSSVPLLERLYKKYNGEFIKVGVSINSEVISQELRDYIVAYKPMVKSICTRSKKIPGAGKDFLSFPGIDYYLLFMDTVDKDDLGISLPFHEFLRELNALKAVHENVRGVFCSGFIPDLENYPVLAHARCPAGVTKLSIMPDGSAYPCYLFFRNEEFRLGNLLSDDFDAIWGSPSLDFFRRFGGNTCTNTGCGIFPYCHGGCPAVSLLLSGDMRAPDPRCAHVR